MELRGCGRGSPRAKGRWVAIAALWLVAFAGWPVSTAWAQGTWLGTYRIDLRANPTVVPADGKTTCRIQAEVRRFDGGFAPDNTQVVFGTDLGSLSSGDNDRRATLTAQTRGGAAIVYLRSDAAGVATVYALVGDSRTMMKVSFLVPGSAGLKAAQRPRSLMVSGKWVGYCVEANAVEARGRSRVSYGGLVFDVGDLVSLNVNTMTLRAVSAVVHRGKASVQAEALVADLQSGQILVQRMVEDTVVRQRLSALTLTTLESDQPIPPGTFSMPEVEGNTWFVGTTVRVFPGEKIVLRSASIYSGVQKVLSLPPYWIIALPGYTGLANSSMLNVGANGDVSFDLPFFFQVTDTWTGAVSLERGNNTSQVSAQSGWSLALHEQYDTMAGTKGTMTLSGIPTGSWGVEWQDRRSMGSNAGSQIYTDFSAPDHRSLFFNTSLYQPGPTRMFNLSASFDKPEDYSSTYGATAQWLTYPKPFRGSRRVHYTLGTSLDLQHGPDTADPNNAGSVLGHEMYGSLDFGTTNLGGQWGLQPRLENVFAWYTDHTRTNTTRAQLSLNGHLGRPNPLRLVYSAEKDTGDALVPGWHHELDAYYTMASGRLAAYVNASRQMSDNNDLAMVTLDYRLTDKYRLGSLLTYYSFGTDTYRDIEMTLSRVFFGQELGVRYSLETGRLTLSAVGLTRTF